MSLYFHSLCSSQGAFLKNQIYVKLSSYFKLFNKFLLHWGKKIQTLFHGIQEDYLLVSLPLISCYSFLVPPNCSQIHLLVFLRHFTPVLPLGFSSCWSPGAVLPWAPSLSGQLPSPHHHHHWFHLIFQAIS